MTFKHITFGDSIVMRSLEKVAMEKGMFDDEPMVKEASIEKKSYDATNNLLNDMLSLTSGLRERGFVAEANALEDKIFTHKKAAKDAKKAPKDEGEKMLDDAHPEGDVEIAPSAGGYGKMLGQKSTQEEIKRIVNKTPTGKLATAQASDATEVSQQLVTEMATAYALEMSARIEMSQEHIFGIVNPHLYLTVKEWVKHENVLAGSGVLNDAAVIFKNDVISEVDDARRDIAIAPDKEEALKINIADAYRRAFYAALNRRRKVSAVDNIIKAVEDALGIVKEADLETINKSKHYKLILDIYDVGKDDNWVFTVNFAYWKGKRGKKIDFYIESQAKKIAGWAAQAIDKYLTMKSKEGYDSQELSDIIEKNVKRNWERYTTPGTISRAPFLDYSRLLDGILYSDKNISTLSETTKYKKDKKDQEEKAAKLKGLKDWNDINTDIITPFENIASQYRFYSGKVKDLSKKENANRKARGYDNYVNDIRGYEDKAPFSFKQIQKMLTGTSFAKNSSWERLTASINNFLVKLKAAVQKKKACFVDDILKTAKDDDDLPEEDDVVGENEGGSWQRGGQPSPGGGTGKGVGVSIIRQMQQALIDLSKVVEKSDKASAVLLRDGGLDGDWKGGTDTGVAEAEKLRAAYKLPNPIQTRRSYQSAKVNVPIIKAITEKAKGGGAAYKGRGASLGVYKRPMGEAIEITVNDVSTLPGFERFLMDTNIMLELDGPPTETEEDNKKSKENLLEHWESDDKKYASRRLERLSQIGSHVDPWAKKEDKEKSDEPTAPVSSNEQIPGLTLKQWNSAIKHFKNEAIMAWHNPETKKKRNTQILYWKLDGLETQINNRAKSQKAGPNQVVNVSFGPGGRAGGIGGGSGYAPGQQYVIVVVDGKRYKARADEAHLYGGAVYPLSGGLSQRPPVSHILDFTREEFGMPQPFQKRLVYRSFYNTSAHAFVNKYFGHTEPKSSREIQDMFIFDNRNELEELRWHELAQSFIVRVNKKNVYVTELPGYKNYLKLFGSNNPKEQAMAFLRLASSRLARAYDLWEQNIPEAELDRVLPPVSRDHSKWQQMFTVMYSKVKKL